MKTHLQELVAQALLDLQRKGTLPKEIEPDIQLERTRSRAHGDFSCNIAMLLAKPARLNPREIAEGVVAELLPSKHVAKTEVAGPGFINFYLTKASLQSAVKQVLARGDEYGHCEDGVGHQVTVEFVSANPTGPLHVGHGRGAAYGASLANILEADGFEVHREYYVNDAGRQMDILAVSVWMRYLELCGERVSFPNNGYKGEYIYDIARQVRQDQGDGLRRAGLEVSLGLAEDGQEGHDKAEQNKREAHIDALITRAKELLGEDGFAICFDVALGSIMDGIRDDLEHFNVIYDDWFSEQNLKDSGSIDRALERLGDAGYLYQEDGATKFAASKLGDEKDRVVVRSNGATTYFASDIAYFLNKLERGFEKAIYVFGADHHGYMARLRAAAEGMDQDPSQLEIMLVQFAHLYRFGEKAQMSTRKGDFVTLRELCDEVGSDAARFFYVMRSHEQHLDFDLELAKKHSQDNPVYYIQYAHARVASVFRKLEEQGWHYNQAIGEAATDRLVEEHESELLRKLSEFPETVANAARNRSPHYVAHYLQDLAQDFHAWYNKHKVLVDDEDLRNARLALSRAVKQVIANGLALLGVSAPEQM